MTLHNPDYASWPREKRIAEAKNCWRRRGMMKAIRWSLPCSITPLESHQRIAIAASSMWKKTSASRRSYRTRSGRRCWIPCIRITSTPSATRGLPTTTMPPPSSILSVPGIARTPVSTATRLTTRRCATRRKASDVATRGKYYQQAEDLLAQDVPAIPVYHYVRTHLVKPWVGLHAG